MCRETFFLQSVVVLTSAVDCWGYTIASIENNDKPSKQHFRSFIMLALVTGLDSGFSSRL